MRSRISTFVNRSCSRSRFLLTGEHEPRANRATSSLLVLASAALLLLAPPADSAAGGASRHTSASQAAARDGHAEIEDPWRVGPVEGIGFGSAAATAGDFDGDGFSDVIIGAPADSAGNPAAGVVFLYRGGNAGLRPLPFSQWESNPNMPSEVSFLGTSVACLGDINGDERDDVIVGAPYYSRNQIAREGVAFIFLGNESGFTESAAETLVAGGESAFFGTSLASAGDVDGNGVPDVVIGAYNCKDPQLVRYERAGAAFLYCVSDSGRVDTCQVLVAPLSDQQKDLKFGQSVSTAGDFDGDGFDDVVIGATSEYAEVARPGRAYVYCDPTRNTTPDYVLLGELERDTFGRSVSTAGDVNGDGYSDIIVGALNVAGPNRGAAYVYYGRPSSATIDSYDQKLVPDDDDFAGGYGLEVACAGDVNADGFADVVVSAEDAAHLYLGSPEGLTFFRRIDATPEGEATSGATVAGGGDINGDGFSDILVGTEKSGVVYGYAGAPFVMTGDCVSECAGVQRLVLDGSSATLDARFGRGLGSAGDIDGDGYGDLVVGAPDFQNGQDDEGAAFVYFGSDSGLVTLGEKRWRFESDIAHSATGECVTGAGDVNNDGFGDFVVTAHACSVETIAPGRVYVFHGAEGVPGSQANWIAGGDQDSMRFGFSAAGAGDVNNDGYADLVVGAPGYDVGDSVDAGAIYVYAGTSGGLDTMPTWVALGDRAGDSLGYHVASAGDVDGDGDSEIIASAVGAEDGPIRSAGCAMLFDVSGGEIQRRWRYCGESVAFGASVAGNLDLNGDGFSEIVVGDDQGRPESGSTGVVYVFEGSASGPVSPPRTVSAPFLDDQGFGVSVAAAGDVNADGLSDLLVGDSEANEGLLDVGRVSLFLGHADSLIASAPEWTTLGDAAGASFGHTVTSAGDINGDGYPDIAVGQLNFTDRQEREGRVVVFYGNSGSGWLARGGPGIQQRQSDSRTPIALSAQSESDGFRIRAVGRSAMGRGRVRLEWQLEPHSPPVMGFDAIPDQGEWLDTGAPLPGLGSSRFLDADAGALTGDARYRWRARVEGFSPFVPHSPWFTVAPSVPSLSQLKTKGDAALYRVTLPSDSVSVDIGSVTDFGATGWYSDQTKRPIPTDAVWESDNPTVATVDSTGRVLAKHRGTAIVRVAYNAFRDSAVVVVRASVIALETATTGPETHLAVTFPILGGSGRADSVLSELGPHEPELWRIWTWSPAESGYTELSDSDSLRPGIGYWLITEKPKRVVLEGVPADPEAFVLPLAGAGDSLSWNQIGNPFSFPIAVSDLLVRSGGTTIGLLDPANTFTEHAIIGGADSASYTPADVLEVMKGYWIKKLVPEDVSLVIPYREAATAPGSPLETIDATPLWRVRISASQGDLPAQTVVVGAADVAPNQWNAMSYSAPPPSPSGDHLALYVNKSDWGLANGKYIRAFDAVADSLSWEICVASSRAPGEILLTIDGSELPSGVRLHFADDTTGASTGVGLDGAARTATLRVAATPEQRRFRVTTSRSTPPTVAPASASTRFRVAYPNPFVRDTGFWFDLKTPARVEVDIFDVSGRRIRSLNRAAAPAGENVLVWDGSTDSGDIAASGLYLARYRAGIASGSTRVVKLK